MAYKFNPATGKWEQQQQPISSAKTPQVNIGRATAPKVNIGQTRPSSPKIDARPPRTSSASSSTPTPPAGPQIGPQLSEVVRPAPTGQAAIDAMYYALYDEANQYRQIYGEEPPSSWWSARTSQIEAAQKRYDAANKAESAGAAAAAKAAAEAKAKEVERQRKIRGGQAAETFLREQAVTRKADMLKRVAELYDPLRTKTEDDLARTLQAASDAFDLAEKQVGEAGKAYEQGITPTKAYGEIPLATFQTAENPLLAALQAQGAQTGEVTAATEQANQFMAQQSALEKWAAGQLNVGQQNYDIAAQNAAKGALQAALMQLGGRRADVKTGIEQQFADALSEIAQKETGAKSDVDQTIADIISKADETKAQTLAEYGTLPKTEPKPPAAPKAPVAPKPVVNKQTVTPTVPKEEPKKKKPTPALPSSLIRRS